MRDAPLLRVERITKAYPGVVANDDVTLDLRRGEIHALLGENGAGKTTLMGVLYGLIRPDSGQILIDGKPVAMHNPRDALGLGIGYVQQHFSLIPTLTVAQNLVLALRGGATRIGFSAGSVRVRELSARYGLQVAPDALVEDLSIGQQQRAELLKALARETRVLLLDEPSAVLTPQESAGLAEILHRLAEAGIGIFLVSHKLEEILRVADRISVLRRGRLVGTLIAAEATRARLAEMMVGQLRAIDTPVVASPREAGAPRLQVEDLWVASDRGGFAVEGVSFEVRAGEVLGVAGVEGNGQVELSEALAGARRPSRGTVRIDGRDVTGSSVRRLQRAGVTHIPADRQRTGLIVGMSIAHNLVLPVADAAPFSRFRVLRPGPVLNRARELIERFDIRTPGPELPAAALSGGNQQKVVLARELSRRPVVVVSCYPTRGLDFAATEAVQREILAQRDAGAAVVYVSVDLDELLALADRIVVLHDGQVSGELAAVEATPEQLGLLMGGARVA